MSEGLNSVMLFGNIGAEPELRQTSGGAVLKLRLATTETYVDRDKERKKRTDWHSVIMFGKRAEALGNMLRKGERIFVEGSLRTSSYEKDGAKVWKTEVVASNIIFGGTGGGGGGGGERAVGSQRTSKPKQFEGASADFDDNVPF